VRGLGTSHCDLSLIHGRYQVIHQDRAGVYDFAADLAIDGVGDFDFQPVARAFFLVTTVPLLGENAFQSLLLGRGEQRLALVEMVGNAKRPCSHNQSGQRLFALLKRQATQVVAIKVNQVEGVIENLYLRIASNTLPPFTNAGALLHQTER